MKILQVLYYYYPHCSGVTIYVERLGKHLVERGHEVTVLTSRHDGSFPREEITADGVRVVRAPVLFSVSRGVVMPTFMPIAASLIRQHDVVHLHLPMTEAAAVAALAKAMGKRVIITHHTDLTLPIGRFNKVAEKVVFVSGVSAGYIADRIVTYTHDRAEVSPYIKRFRKKTQVVYPPVEIGRPTPEGVRAFREKHGLGDKPIVGFAGRFAEEKGLDYLLRTIPLVNAALPGVQYVFAGPYLNVVGETLYERSQPLLREHRDHVLLLGVLRGDELMNFYAACDVLTLPSVNFTETFGLVQVEAMLCGTPVVASDLPGVREATRVTGMGRTAPPRDVPALAEALIDVVKNHDSYVRPREEIAARFSMDATVDAYERIFRGER
ncbi:MAG: glycosyltransferase family 4 protein [Thermomicrobiales bacterium]|nr:glycosyltransferase family 4 protein [Thermomicrobiales bacterium]